MKAKTEKVDVYKIVTERILDALDRGVVPWRKPWTSSGAQRSLASRKPYRGINQILLTLEAHARGYESPFWVTFNQAKNLGGQVRKGERSTLVTFWRQIEITETTDTGEKRKKKIPLLRYYRLFNADQCDGIKTPKLERGGERIDPVEAADAILAGYDGPTVSHGGNRAYYRPATDSIRLPARGSFKTKTGYYAVSFHEHAHSTGHESRLNRDLNNGFGTDPYAKEELVAEMTAAFLLGEAGILDEPEIENAAAYIDGWRSKLSRDPKLIVSAAAAAQRAADLILGTSTPAEAPTPEPQPTTAVVALAA